jgi:hypothetical protein
MDADIVTGSASEQPEEADTPSAEVLPTRYIPWIPVLAFVQILCIFTIFFSVFSLTSCATLESNSKFYRSLPDPCAGKARSGQDPLCGSPAL